MFVEEMSRRQKMPCEDDSKSKIDVCIVSTGSAPLPFNTPKVGLGTIPVELVRAILTFLTVRQLCRNRMVSTMFNELGSVLVNERLIKGLSLRRIHMKVSSVRYDARLLFVWWLCENPTDIMFMS
ncbi:hypothetical protein BC938DRAFT_477262 [Jimgerdemannia flammicorona]|uniref:F-box domain-containing protein n=1 Tax=Jimgerdemannia flammicorona TaxID=994334 RepID=A0A433QYW6_9FUNG|nr:hypothetical protein BC938DRAFT_477262 [Jimgerdemannia flammicorona]